MLSTLTKMDASILETAGTCQEGDKYWTYLNSVNYNADDNTTVPMLQVKGTEARKPSVTGPRSTQVVNIRDGFEPGDEFYALAPSSTNTSMTMRQTPWR